MRRLLIALSGFSLWLMLALTPMVAPVLAADIEAGLCAGAELRFTDNPTGAKCDDEGAVNKINDIVHTIINLISAVVAIVAVVMIIFGGLRYITSGGNDANVTSAKNTILYAIIGLVIVALAQILVRFTLSKITNS